MAPNAKHRTEQFQPKFCNIEESVSESSVFWMNVAAVIFCAQYILVTPLFVYLSYKYLFTPYILLPICYCAWIFYDRNSPHGSSRRHNPLRHWWMYRTFADHFSARLIKTATLPGDRNYVFGCHPHGAASISHFINFATEGTGFSEKFPGIQPNLISMSFMFWMVITRDIYLYMGGRASSHESIDGILSQKTKGHSVAIVVGGVQEILNAGQEETLLTLKYRKGFVRKAVIHGASLVPVFTFGENELYKSLIDYDSPTYHFVRKFYNATRFLIPTFIGRGLFLDYGILPLRRKLTTVVGKPIHIDKPIPNPTEEEVDRVHRRYMFELSQLYEDNKHFDAEYFNKPLRFV